MVRHGITSCRDLGGKGASLVLRERIRIGECVGPRMLVAGQPITRPGGHCHQWGGAAVDEEQICQVPLRAVTCGDVR